jgi:hypothetical protein
MDMNVRVFIVLPMLWFVAVGCLAEEPRKQFLGTLKMEVPHIRTDDSVKYDFPIVYVRAPRRSPDGKSRWAEVGGEGSKNVREPETLI